MDIVNKAQADGVKISVLDGGHLELSGSREALAKWKPIIARQKQEVIRVLDEARREAFEERAAILEFDAGLSRQEAERHAHEECDEPTAWCWRVTLPGGAIFVHCSPRATRSYIADCYPNALLIEVAHTDTLAGCSVAGHA